MECATRQVCYLTFGIIVSSLLVGLSPVSAEEPTLARLSFWVPPERMEEFVGAYEERVAPLLKKHGFLTSSMHGRTTVDSVFSRLFAFETPAGVAAKRKILQYDSEWRHLLQDMGRVFRSEDEDGLIPWHFGVYECSAGTGRPVSAGGGRRQGEWLSFDVQDGLPESTVNSILLDRDGLLWFGTHGGVSRYDGEHFTSFTTADGLASNRLLSLLQDRQGYIWFGTTEGVSRYDGEHFTTFTTADGLAGWQVNTMTEDRDGHLWFGTKGTNGEGTGVGRYDGERFTTLTMAEGLVSNRVRTMTEDRDGHLWFGTDQGISRYDGESFITLTTAEGLADNQVYSILQDRGGQLWFGTNSGMSRYDGKSFENFYVKPFNRILSMVEDEDGHLWFGSFFSGVYRYDGKEFTHFTTADGLPHKQVYAVAKDREDHLWVGTLGGGVSRYDGAQFATFTAQNGLPGSYVFSFLRDSKGDLWFGTAAGLARYDGRTFTQFIGEDSLGFNQANFALEDREGNLWFSTRWFTSGVRRFDGENFTAFTEENGLASNAVSEIVEDSQGNMWFATRKGVNRFDGEEFAHFTTADGLVSNVVVAILEDREGNLWFGTTEGISRYDGREFTSFTRREDMGIDEVNSIAEDQKGHLWFGGQGGVCRYDGKEFTTFTVEDGLKPGNILSVTEDLKGHLWFGIYGGGITRYDGLVFQHLSRRDGLVNDAVQSVFHDANGDVWIGADGGATRFRPSTKPPSVRLKEVVANRSYGSIQDLTLPSSQALVIFAFQGRSFSTPSERMAYVYRLQGYEDEWQPTRQKEVRYTDLPNGDYVFQVQAVDRDLNYSEPVAVRLTVHPPYRQLALIGILCLSLVGLVVVSGYALKKRHDLFVEMEEELQVAHDMQMSLMPGESPEIGGFDIAGRCLPFNHVGGDFFQYFPQDGKLAICMADVTGHAMEAAVPVMMFSGVLKTEMDYGHSVQQLFSKLNGTMNSSLDDRTYVCFCMGELDVADRRFRLANAACPYPFHFRAATGEVEEMQVDAYPLGVQDGTVYTTIETVLDQGDQIVFCSDGIAEATNVQEEMFGFERTAEVIRLACAEDLSAEALIDRLIGGVQDFAGDVPQGDDMTVVVLKVETL